MKRQIVILLLYISLNSALFPEKKTIKLKNREECQNDIEEFCPDVKGSNILVIACLQDSVTKEEQISNECQKLIWEIKQKITLGKGNYVPETNYALCNDDLENIQVCKNVKNQGGPYISCLIAHLEEIKKNTCLRFLRTLQPIILSSHKLIFELDDVCTNDIKKLKCEKSDNSSLSQQGATIYCLLKDVSLLEDECRKHMLKVAEQQARNWKVDRVLYFACRGDKENFCANVKAGASGQVYDCLFKHKNDPSMSQECKNELRQRQKLAQHDVKVNHQFYQSCLADIKTHKCYVEHDDKALAGTDDLQALTDITLSVTLKCLILAKAKGAILKANCVKEIMSIQKQLMSDSQIDPLIVSSCTNELKRCEDKEELKSLSARGLLSSGTHKFAIHCLMDFARNAPKHTELSDAISKACYTAMNKLFKEVDLVDNLDADPAFEYDCAMTINKYCKHLPRDDPRMFGCLLSLLGKKEIDSECSNRVLEIHFFAARDFKLSGDLMGVCESEIEQCKSKILGIDEISHKDAPQKQSMMLSCLYRNHGSPKCKQMVKLALEERAKSVDLPPELQESCITDMATFCKETRDRDDEVACLEEHYDDLSKECKKHVMEQVEEEEEIPLITRLFLDSCENFWEEHCAKEKSKIDKSNKDSVDGADGKDLEATELMECLIRNKNHEDMPPKCRAGIEHHQLISLKHFTPSSRFKNACLNEIQEHCSQHKNKMAVLKCLSETVYNDSMVEAPHKVSQSCRHVLTFEILQKKESLRLDTDLKDACKSDREKFCKDVKTGRGAVARCLRDNQAELSPECNKHLFQRELKEAKNSETDFGLVNRCKRMIEEYCEGNSNIIECLTANQMRPEFDQQCKQVLVNRQRLRSKDIRLNPKLMNDCQNDIKKHCMSQMASASKNSLSISGAVIECLRKVYVHKIRSSTLTQSCSKHITEILKRSALDDMQDASLQTHCAEAIKARCYKEADLDKISLGGTKVFDCLKNNLISTNSEAFRAKHMQCFHMIIQRLSESKVDFHIDPILSRICSLDAQVACRGVVSGDGRIMSCLLSHLNEDETKLSPNCRKALHERSELWNLAVKLAPPESVGDLVDHIHSSSASTYIETILFIIILVIFIGGLLCGRITKRVSKQAKSK